MSDVSKRSSTAMAREGKLTFSPVARHLQRVGHEILNGGGLTLVETHVMSTCPEPVKLFTDRLLRAHNEGIPLIEVSLVGTHDGYARVNRALGVNGKTIGKVLHADGIERHDRRDGVAELEFKAVGLSMFSPEEMLRCADEDMPVGTYAEFATFKGYDGSLTDFMGLPKEPIISAGYANEDGTCLHTPDASPMYRVINQAMADLPRALRAESTITAMSEEVVGPVQLAPGAIGSLGA